MKNSFFLILFLITVNVVQAQDRWAISYFGFGVSPETGMLTYGASLDYNRNIRRQVFASNRLPEINENYPIVQNQTGGSADFYRHYSLFVGLNPYLKADKSIYRDSRWDFGLTYIPAIGREVTFLKADPNEDSISGGQSYEDVSVRFVERADQLNLMARYQIRLTQANRRIRFYMGFEFRGGTELRPSYMMLERRAIDVLFADSANNRLAVVERRKLENFDTRRSIYLSALMPMTVERDIKGLLTIYSTFTMGWGYRGHSMFSGLLTEKYTVNYLEFGLKYNLSHNKRQFR